jgi:hypothetical protein
VRDATVSKANEMIDGQAHSHIVIRNDGRNAVTGLGSINWNDGKATLDAEGDELVVLRDSRQYQAVHALTEKRLNERNLLRGRVACVCNYWSVTFGRKDVAYANENGSEYRIGNVREQSTDEVRSMAQVGSRAPHLL